MVMWRCSSIVVGLLLVALPASASEPEQCIARSKALREESQQILAQFKDAMETRDPDRICPALVRSLDVAQRQYNVMDDDCFHGSPDAEGAKLESIRVIRIIKEMQALRCSK